MILLKFIFILTLGIDLASCDLSLFPTETIELEVNSKASHNNHDQDTNLNLFQQKECPDIKEYDKSLIDKEVFCQDHCTVKLSTYQGHCYKKGKFLSHSILFNNYPLN